MNQDNNPGDFNQPNFNKIDAALPDFVAPFQDREFPDFQQTYPRQLSPKVDKSNYFQNKNAHQSRATVYMGINKDTPVRAAPKRAR